jgi:hypothetical protein
LAEIDSVSPCGPRQFRALVIFCARDLSRNIEYQSLSGRFGELLRHEQVQDFQHSHSRRSHHSEALSRTVSVPDRTVRVK